MVEDTALFIYRLNNPNDRGNKISLGNKAATDIRDPCIFNMRWVKVETRMSCSLQEEVPRALSDDRDCS